MFLYILLTILKIDDLVILTFSDASHANSADGTSQGETLHFSPVVGYFSVRGGIVQFCHSKKLKSIAKSSTCAGVQACANTYDEMK